jgi:predicted amidohydrolase
MFSKTHTYLYDESKAAKRIKVASVAMACDREAASNRDRIISTIDAIMQTHPDVEMVIFGEMTLGWYKPGELEEYHQGISEHVPGPTTRALAELALKYGIYVCFGISELEGVRLYNSQVLLDPQGEIQALYRKRNLKPGEVKAHYHPGPAMVTTTEIKGVKTGMVICSDTASTRTMWELMCGRLELIIHSLADDDRDDFVTRFQARMYDAWFITLWRRRENHRLH